VLLAGLLLALRLLAGGQPKILMVVFPLVASLLLAPAKLAFFARWLAHPVLAGVGVASYSLYLLHQRAGLTVISVLAEQLGLKGPASLDVSILVAAATVAIAKVIFRFWETPLNRRIVRACGFSRPPSTERARARAGTSTACVADNVPCFTPSVLSPSAAP
jgi:peptidoglycan/LPS O-acetylase OafA/YrhL